MEVKYPGLEVKLLGENGNAFNLIGITAKALRKHAGKEAAEEFLTESMEQKSYDDLLAYIQRIVTVI